MKPKGRIPCILILVLGVISLFLACEDPMDAANVPAYTVSFSANGGSGTVPGPLTVNAGSSITLPSGGGLAMSSCTFGGWNTNNVGTGINYPKGSSLVPTSDITLYAKWDAITIPYTVAFSADGGTPAPAQQNIAYGGKVTEPAAMTKTGYTFGGWFKETAFTNQWNFATDIVTSDITLYAKWDAVAIPYTVAFSADGGTPAPTQQTVGHGGKVTEPAAMTKTGYTFGGWFKEMALINKWNFATDTVSANITLYAKWSLNQIYVTFVSNGGTFVPDQAVTIGGKVAEPEGIARTGHTLDGWYMDNNTFLYRWNFATDIVSSNITLYAKWNINRHTVTFNTDGGIPAPAQQTVDLGSKVTEPAATTKIGYTFGGWFKEAALINQWNFATDTVTGNITLYAKWMLNQYTATFNANGGTPAPTQQTVDHGGKVTEPPAMTRSGYLFDAWYKEAAFTNKWNFVTDTATGPLTLYAKWIANQYTVVFNADGGTPAPAQQTVDHGGKVIEPPPMNKTWSTFGGWFKDAPLTNQWNFGADTVTGNITLYAKWTPTQYTVAFSADGGTPAPAQQNITFGGKVTEPPAMTRSGYIFGGWFKEAALTNQWDFATDTVAGQLTLYARWHTFVPGTNLAAKLSWLQTNAISDVDYTIEVTANEDIAPHVLSYNERSNIGITLKGIGATQTVGLLSTGILFTVSDDVTLVLDNNITLRGRTDNTSSLIIVNNGGTLVMNAGSRITGNTAAGSGVYVNGTFTMNGGEISSNSRTSPTNGGGGVYIGDTGTFTMNGGKIFGNTSNADGGGVYTMIGTFTMNGGEISSNTIPSNRDGGGVYVMLQSGRFTMSGTAKISGNKASSGGGVYTAGTFTMSGGEISGNTASYAGGGVYAITFSMSGGKISGNTVSSDGSTSRGGGVYGSTFSMSGGEISGNTVSGNNYANNGGGVYTSSFRMEGGVISGNTVSGNNFSSSYGGGVYVYRGRITKTGGTITGYASDTANGNVVRNYYNDAVSNRGHAVYVEDASTTRRRETTAGPNFNLDSTIMAGWEN